MKSYEIYLFSKSGFSNDILEILSDIEANIDYPEYDIEETTTSITLEETDAGHVITVFVIVAGGNA